MARTRNTAKVYMAKQAQRKAFLAQQAAKCSTAESGMLSQRPLQVPSVVDKQVTDTSTTTCTSGSVCSTSACESTVSSTGSANKLVNVASDTTQNQEAEAENKTDEKIATSSNSAATFSSSGSVCSNSTSETTASATTSEKELTNVLSAAYANDPHTLSDAFLTPLVGYLDGELRRKICRQMDSTRKATVIMNMAAKLMDKHMVKRWNVHYRNNRWYEEAALLKMVLKSQFVAEQDKETQGLVKICRHNITGEMIKDM